MEKAREYYPSSGSGEGRPTLWHFERGPLEAARQFFSRSFEEGLVESQGSPVRYWVTRSSFFPALGFFAIRVGDYIEILDFDIDESYWELVGDDPEE